MKVMTGAHAATGAVGGRRGRSWHAGAVKRVGWGLGDQALSSLTNFAVGILVARSVSVPDFGAYALAFSAYCFILGISRALATEPFAVRFVIAEPEQLHRARAAVAGVALLTGIAFLALAMMMSQMLPQEYRSLAVCLGAVLPGLLVQDSVRQILFAAGRGRSAFNNDLLWAVLMVPAFAGVFLSGSASSATLILAWGAAATLAAVVGCFQCRVVPGIGLIKSWLNSQRGLWAPFLVEGAAINGAQQVVFFAIGAFVGLSAVGEMKLALVLLGPVNVLVQGLGVVAVPEAARAIAAGRSRFLRVTSVFSLAVAFGALLWGLTVTLLPGSWGAALVGQGWLTASALVLPMFLVQVFNGAKTGAAVGLRGMGAASRSMWTRISTSSLVVVISVAGAAIAGVQGAAWGLVVAAALSTVLWYLQFKNVYSQYPFTTDKPELSRHLAERSQPREVAVPDE
ncbi:Membrane protein involved in the export of O-antigen and teichoic acid [Arthrobacter sp. ok362]|nr:Membrane protein involved in the export of O-antigen and teichoic acid [Arthrobacter sp. ok362]